MMKKILFLILALVLMVSLFFVYKNNQKDPNKQTISIKKVNNFYDCVAAGNPVMEGYPRQCQSPDGQFFIEDIGNFLEKTDLIRLDYPFPNQEISSPLEITGHARGPWYFEASFPVFLLNSKGDIISEGIATAEDDWMTENFVSFRVLLNFDIPKSEKGKVGRLIFKKDNPSGLEENDDSLEIPVIFSSN